MSCPIKYDLSHKINTANGKMNVKNIMIDELEYSAFLYSLYVATDLLNNREDGIRWLQHICFTSGFVAFKIVTRVLFQKVFLKNEFKRNACRDLKELLIDLKEDLNIETTVDLLKNSKVTKVEYPRIKQKGIPILNQCKYFSIPAYSMVEEPTNMPTGTLCRSIENVTVLQEHRLTRTKKYKLSIVDPIKKKN